MDTSFSSGSGGQITWSTDLAGLITVGNDKGHSIPVDGVQELTCTVSDNQGLCGTSAPRPVTVV